MKVTGLFSLKQRPLGDFMRLNILYNSETKKTKVK